MSRIRSKNTKPEIIVRKFLFARGLRYRLHEKKLPAKPDIVLPKFKTVIFIHGCFWHGHEGCRYFVHPKTRTEWWKAKIGKNKSKDKKANSELSELGWNVIVIWECQLKPANREKTLESMLNMLQGRNVEEIEP